MKNTTVLFLGGLGNQLFQYAFMTYLEKVLGTKVSYNLSYHKKIKVHSGFEADRFFDFSPFTENKKDYYSLPFRLYRKLPFRAKRILCDDLSFKEGKLFRAYEGYWQDIRFYSAVKDVLKERFLGIDRYCTDKALLEELRSTNSVFLHVRRGDYCKDPRYLDLCATNYYKSAVAYMRERLPDARFFVFSDDLAWSRSYFNDQADFSFVSYKGQTPLGDLAAMLAAKNAVIANSSFSWWGTALDSKNIVVHPTSYYTSGESCPLYFDSWHGITSQKTQKEKI